MGTLRGDEKMTRPNTFVHRQSVAGFILALLLVGGCAAPARPVAMPSITPLGEVIVPSPTQRPNTPTVVPRLFSTLTPEQEKAYVFDMLKTNGGCEPPCWWGVAPGSATLQTLRDGFGGTYENGMLRQDGVRLFSGPNFEILNASNLLDFRIGLGFGERDGIVHEIGVSAEVNAETQPGQFASAWQRYSIDHVLAQYGVPSRVQIQLVPPIEPGAPPSYAMTLVYEEHGFWIRYEGPATYDLDKAIVHACPSLSEVTRIQLRLRSSTASTRTPLFQPDPDGFDRSLEEATGMNLKAFYENFKDASKQTCLEGAPTLP